MDNPSNTWRRTMQTVKLALLSVLTALCLGLQLVPRPPNLEFTSLFSFVTGMLFGSLFGAGLGASVMFINGFLSPYGPAGSILPFQIVGMVIIGAAGGIYRRMSVGKLSLGNALEPLVLGAFLTFVYDVITNVGTALFLQGPVLSFPQALVVALVAGVIPSIMHVAWNSILFGAVTVPLVNAVQKAFVWRWQA